LFNDEESALEELKTEEAKLDQSGHSQDTETAKKTEVISSRQRRRSHSKKELVVEDRGEKGETRKEKVDADLHEDPAENKENSATEKR
jgi:hypothetical protein